MDRSVPCEPRRRGRRHFGTIEIISLPGLPCFPPTDMGAPMDHLLRPLAALESLPKPLITGYDGRSGGVVQSRLAPLADPLAAHMPGHLQRPAFQLRSGLEARIADALDPVPPAAVADAAAWHALLHDIAFRVHGCETPLRQSAIGTEPGFGGTIVAYPPPRQIRWALGLISQEIALHPAARASEVAAFVMLACTTVHPFLDGNGRIARILFNLILRSQFPRLPYIAIKEITQFAQGDFLIAINRVHYQQDWAPLLRWLVAILDIHLAIGTGTAPAAGVRAT